MQADVGEHEHRVVAPAAMTYIQGADWLPIKFSNTGASIHLVGVPFCPDLLRYADLGAADSWRGRVIRFFFWCLRWWR